MLVIIVIQSKQWWFWSHPVFCSDSYLFSSSGQHACHENISLLVPRFYFFIIYSLFFGVMSFALMNATIIR